MIELDFRNPDYPAIFRRRAAILQDIRLDPSVLVQLKRYYREHPAQFITDWGMTQDPKQIELHRSAMVPFVLFPKQAEWVDWVIEHWRNQKPGITEKTRQMGFSWLSVSLACTLCMFNDGMNIGFGSRKEEYVDKIGDPKSLFYKARFFMTNLPPEFRSGWDPAKHAPWMRIVFPGTDSTITGEAGDNIGRGNTTSLYFVDEAAFLERPQLVEASLSQTTNCRMDISTPNGLANPFAEKRHSGKIDVFTFHWMDDPRKDQAWYEKQVAELDPVTLAQEVDIDYSASVEGVVIPNAWVQACVDAHRKLGIEPTGERSGSLDVADEGVDLNAFCGAHGFMVEFLEEWSGKGGDIFATVGKTFLICDERGYKTFRYDADGLGAGVRGDSRVLNDKRDIKLDLVAFRGSAEVYLPESEDVKGRKNKDFFSNLKAQSWWSLRLRCYRTFMAVTAKAPYVPDDILSISSQCKNYRKLVGELSRPTYKINQVGKIVIDKKPDGTKSPNLADAVMMQFGMVRRSMMIRDDVLIAA